MATSTSITPAGHGRPAVGPHHPAVVRAVAEQVTRGRIRQLPTNWKCAAELVQQLVPSAHRVRFTSSGTEATLLALRLSRAHTGRSRSCACGAFHGWHDHMAFGVTSHFDGTPTPGVLPAVAGEIRLVQVADRASVAAP